MCISDLQIAVLEWKCKLYSVFI